MAGQRKVEAKRWFQQASYDLKAVRWNIQSSFYDTACFLAQQAGEKALKSLLYPLTISQRPSQWISTPLLR
jgi:HEPN domain-containing protein